MKKFLLTSALLATSLFSFAQTVIPNGDFEEWEESSCGQVPSKYKSSSDIAAEDLEAPCPEETGITKSTTKYSGTYALEITPQIVSVVFEAPTGASEAKISEVPSTMSLGNAVFLFEEFTGRPTKLVGYTKFTKGGSDTLGISVAIGNEDDEDEVASAELTISASQSDYTKFEIPLVYNTLNTSKVNAIAIIIGIGDKEQNASESTSALIDGLSFVYTPTATVDYQSTSSINVFAANKTINFSENVSDVRVVDMVGASQLQQAASLKTLNAATLNTGLYIVTYKYNDNYYSKKVVIE